MEFSHNIITHLYTDIDTPIFTYIDRYIYVQYVYNTVYIDSF